MGCVRASGAPGSSRRQPEMTRKVFRELNVVAQQHKNSQYSRSILFHAPDSNTMATTPMKIAFTKRVLVFRAIAWNY